MKTSLSSRTFVFPFVLLLLLMGLIIPYSCKKTNIDNQFSNCTADSFVLLESESSLSINRFQGDQIEQINTFDLSESTHFAYDGCHHFVLLDNESQKMWVYNRSGKLYYEEDFPVEIQLISVFTDGKNVFLGGSDGESKFLQYNLITRKWYIPYVPDLLQFPGKSIDDFVIHGNQLIAIDNVFIPQYFLYYELNDSSEVEYSDKFFHRVPYPNKISVARNSQDYLGVKTHVISGYVGYYDLIVIYPFNSMEEKAMVFSSKKLGLLNEGRIVDFFIYGNEIFFAYNKHGIGRISIEEEFLRTEIDILKWDYEYYEPHIEYIEMDELVSLTPIPNALFYIATTTNLHGEYEHHILPY